MDDEYQEIVAEETEQLNVNVYPSTKYKLDKLRLRVNKNRSEFVRDLIDQIYEKVLESEVVVS